MLTEHRQAIGRRKVLLSFKAKVSLTQVEKL